MLFFSSKNKAKAALKKGRGTVIVGGYFNQRTGQLEYLRHRGPEHVLCFAPSRSGKGVGLIVPTLLTLEDSAVVTDMKGENWALTAGFRRAMGQHVVFWNPVAHPVNNVYGKVAPEAGSARYNPLTEVRLGTEDEVRDVQNIAGTIQDPTGHGKEGGSAHWVNSATALTTGVALHLLYSPAVPPEDRSLAGIRRFLSRLALMTEDKKSEDPVRDAFEAMSRAVHATPDDNYYWQKTPDGKRFTHPIVQGMAGVMMNLADRERSSVISSANANLSMFDDPLICANTSVSDFALRDLMYNDKAMTLYLVVPSSDQERVNPLMRLIVTQLVARLTESDSEAKKRKHSLLLLLDEFPAFGKLDAIHRSIAFTAGFGIRMFLITQSLSQLKTAYGNGADDIVSNCHIRISYAPNEIGTAELLSKMCGTTTVHVENISTSVDSLISVTGKSYSKSMQAVARPLMTADECMALPGPVKEGELIKEPGDMLIFVAGNPPIYGKQSLYFFHPVWSARNKIKSPPKSDTVRLVEIKATKGAVSAGAPSAATTPAVPAPASEKAPEVDPLDGDLGLPVLELMDDSAAAEMRAVVDRAMQSEPVPTPVSEPAGAEPAVVSEGESSGNSKPKSPAPINDDLAFL